MTRSDGKFPQYARLDLNRKDPPNGWNEGSRRCIKCKKDWPNLPEFSPSPCCDERAGIVSDGEVDISWPDAYAELMRFRFNRIYEKWNEGTTDIELAWANDEAFSDEEISEGMKKLTTLIDSLEKESAHDGSTI